MLRNVVLLIFILNIGTAAEADEPIFTAISGQQYSCSAVGSVSLCPDLNIGLAAVVAAEQVICLQNLQQKLVTLPSHEDFSKCFISQIYREYGKQLRLMNTAASCRETQINKCSNELLSDFIKRLASKFSDIDFYRSGVSACRLNFQPVN